MDIEAEEASKALSLPRALLVTTVGFRASSAFTSASSTSPPPPKPHRQTLRALAFLHQIDQGFSLLLLSRITIRLSSLSLFRENIQFQMEFQIPLLSPSQFALSHKQGETLQEEKCDYGVKTNFVFQGIVISLVVSLSSFKILVWFWFSKLFT